MCMRAESNIHEELKQLCEAIMSCNLLGKGLFGYAHKLDEAFILLHSCCV